MFKCRCGKTYTPEAAAKLKGECICGQGLANEQGIGWRHLNPQPKTVEVKKG
jgi:hypothetical protein